MAIIIHHHHHGDAQAAGPFPWRRMAWAVLLVLFAVAAASLVQVRSGEATVITRFGNPSRVLLEPGLGWRWPAPFEAAIPVDLRLRTTSSGLQDVGTRDGLRIIVQAYVAWQVQGDPTMCSASCARCRTSRTKRRGRFAPLSARRWKPRPASFDLSSLVNTDASQVRIADFEAQLRSRSISNCSPPTACAWCRWASNA
jgi:membrane protease subunit HflC